MLCSSLKRGERRKRMGVSAPLEKAALLEGRHILKEGGGFETDLAETGQSKHKTNPNLKRKKKIPRSGRGSITVTHEETTGTTSREAFGGENVLLSKSRKGPNPEGTSPWQGGSLPHVNFRNKEASRRKRTLSWVFGGKTAANSV